MTSPVLELDDVTRIHGSGATAVHALRGVSLAVEAGELVAVVGCGPIGLCLIQLARVAGASRIIAVEPLAHRRAAAAALGADVVLDAADAGAALALASATAGRGVDVAFEVAGTDDGVGLAVHAAKPGGLVVLVGIPGDDLTTFPASIARRKGLTLKLVRRMKEMYPRTIRLVDAGLVDVASIVQTQRSETMRTLQALTRLKIDAADRPDDTDDTAWHLVLERLIFDAEAEARWLDHVESRLLRASAAQDTTPPRDPATGETDRAEQGTAR